MPRRLGVVAERALDLGDLDRLIDAKRQQRAAVGGVELTVEAQRDVRREGEARSRVREPTVLDAFVQLTKRAVRIERQHDDLGLHEPNGRPTRSVSGGVELAIGSRIFRSSSIGVAGAIGPAPDDPMIVMCGGMSRASFGSKRA